jgi:hypothetical protein
MINLRGYGESSESSFSDTKPLKTNNCQFFTDFTTRLRENSIRFQKILVLPAKMQRTIYSEQKKAISKTSFDSAHSLNRLPRDSARARASRYRCSVLFSNVMIVPASAELGNATKLRWDNRKRAAPSRRYRFFKRFTHCATATVASGTANNDSH